MKKGQMGWPFYTKSHELHYQLKRLGRGFNEFYDNMVCEAIVREDWEEEGTIWVRGTFRASKVEMRRWQPGISRRTFQSRWAKLIEAGIIEEKEDGSFDIPRYKKRGEEGIREAEVKIMSQDLQETKQEVGQIKEDVQEIKEILQAGTDIPKAQKTGNESAEAGKKIAKTGKKIAKTGNLITPPHPFKGLDKSKIKISLSSLNTVISGFYKGIGQNRIAKEKRERAFKIAKNLRNDGFSLEDIAFAVEWTLENAKEEPYDFAIIQHTIGQAIAARDKQESERREIEERDREKQEERSEREAEEREREEIEEHKAKLNAKDREALREKAEAEISAAGIYKPGFISEPLIAAKENELVRRELEK